MILIILRRLRLVCHILALAGLPLSPALAQQPVRILAGEHPDFTRLVFYLSPQTGWQLGRSDAGYDLALALDAARFELADVFARIPPTRITALEPVGASALRIHIRGDTHAAAFRTAQGQALVVDIRDGPPDDSARFEAPLPPPDARTREPVAEGEAGAEGPAGAAADSDSREAMPGPPPGRRALPPPSRDAQAGPGPPAPAAMLPEIALQGTSAGAALPDLGLSATLAEGTSPSASALEAELLRQIGRAASQGLLHLSPGDLGTLDATPRPSAGPGPAAGDQPAPADRPSPDLLPATSRTSIDMALDRPGGPSVSPGGSGCPARDIFDLPAWQDGRPFADQLQQAQSGLLGEFDRPQPERVEALARLYLAFGFGAEARSVLQAFPLPATQAAPLAALADLVDTGRTGQAAFLADLAECPGPEVLWAVLAMPRLSATSRFDAGALQQAFSALPLPLRRHLGPILADRLLGAGLADQATAIRDAILRAPGDHGPSVEMLEARIDLARGRADAAQRKLRSAAKDAGPAGTTASLELAEALIDQGRPFDPGLIDSLSALAFENRDGELGPRLRRAEVLGLALADRYDEAFAATNAATAEEATAPPMVRELFRHLLEHAPDLTFLRQYFTETALLDRAAPPAALRQGIAARLLDLGFPDAAADALKSATSDPAGRMLAARIGLSRGQPEAALEWLSGLDEAQAQAIRGTALSALGRHPAAAEAFIAADLPQAAASEHWRAGNWEAVRRDGTEAQRALLDTPTPEDAAPMPVPGPARASPGLELSDAQDPLAPSLAPSLARGRQLLTDSRETREAVARLLATPGQPASPGPGTAASPAPPGL